MRSSWQAFDQADVAARKAHAARIAAVAKLLDVYPAVTLVGEISSRSQVLPSTARAWVREAAEPRERPELQRASADGELSGDQVAALRVLASPGTDGCWVESLALGTDDFRINELSRLARKETARALERTDGGRYLTMAPTRDERFVKGRFQLYPEEAAALEDALDSRVPQGTRWTDFPRAHADALMELVGSGGLKATVVVRSQEAVLEGASDAPGELSTGNFVPAQVVRELAADGRVLRLDLSGVDLGTDDIPAAVRRWVWYRDQGRCRGIDCTTPRLGLQVHHMLPRTAPNTHHPTNLVLLCYACHAVKIHRLGWKVTGDAGAELTWLRPDGAIYTPPPVLKRARAPDDG